MSIPKPHEPEDYESKPLRKSTANKPNLKDFDDEANWLTSPTNPSVEYNIITGRVRTKDFSNPEHYPKSI